ncbi:IS630 family transposase [Deferrisoma palaeochoriense]
MNKIDARSVGRPAQQLLRRQAIHLRNAGRTFREIAETLGVHEATVRKWWKTYKEQGAQALRLKKRGRKPGQCRSLTPEQERELKRTITDKTPDQLKMPWALWTRRSIQEFIRRRWGITMPVRTIGDYLKRWGFTPQKPLRRAYEQNPKAVEKWLNEEYPAIRTRAKRENAEIHWGDETGLRSDSQHGRSYAPRGQTPEIHLSVNRVSVNLISSITNQGKVRFMTYTGTMNSQTLIRFLRRLIKDADRKVFLILDNLRVHHSKPVKAWLAAHQEEIEVFYLPSYSPELNPDEYPNCDLKAEVHSGPPARTAKELRNKAISVLRKIQNLPARVRSYYMHPAIQYAAA